MDREISPDLQRKSRNAKIIKIATVICLLVLALVGFRAVLKPSIEGKSIVTSIADLGSIEATVSASGLVVPFFEQVITSPVTARIEHISKLSGDQVKAQQSIMKLDLQSVMADLEKLQDQESLKKNTASQMKLQLERNLSDLKNQYDIKTLQIASLESILQDEIHLKTIGGSTDYNVQAARLNLQIAQKEARLLEQQIHNQIELNAVDLKGLSFELNILRKEIQEIKRKLALAQITTQQDGVITWVNEDVGATVAEGEVLVKVADLSSFKVEGSISDVYADHLQIGGDVLVRINQTDLRGTVTNIHPAVDNGIITFMVRLADKSNSVLRSNLRTEVFVVTSLVDGVVRVKNGPFYSGAVDQKVFVVEDGKAIRRKVDIGVSNFDYVELKSGIQPGEVVVISDMEDYEHHQVISIN